MKKYTIAAGLLLFLSACVREVSFQQANPDSDVLVVDALLTDGLGPHTVRLTRLANYENRDFPNVEGASVILNDDQGNTWTYKSVAPALGRPYYELTGMRGETGRTYTLSITLADGSRYRSTPQTMPERIRIDSASVQGQSIPFTNSDGIVRSEEYAALYAHASPQRASGYLYWEMDAIYVFDEISKTYTNPMEAQHRCYVTDYFNRNNLPLFDLSKRTANTPIHERIGAKLYDISFRHGVGFSVYQRSLNKEAYEYLRKAQSLISQTGTIFDQAPAIPVGNMYKVEDDKTAPLGIFMVAAVDTAHTIVLNGELGTKYYVDPNYCRLRFGVWPPVNHYECHDCLSLNRSVYDKPMWWNR